MDAAKGFDAAAKASAGGVIEFMTDGSVNRAFGGDETVSVRLRSAADARLAAMQELTST